MANTVTSFDHIFQALADTTRRSILTRLVREPISVSKLAQLLSMSLPAVMHHLAVLERAALVHSEKIGVTRVCRIEPKTLHLAEQWIHRRQLDVKATRRR